MNKRIKKKKGISKITKDDIIDLDYTLAKYTLPRLKEFKKMKLNSKLKNCPNGMTFEKWIETIDEMIWAFNYYMIKPEFVKTKEEVKDRLRYRDGMALFSTYFHELWD